MHIKIVASLCASTVCSIFNLEGIKQHLKAVYTAEKLGTDVSKKEYGPHIFACVNNPYHVLGDGYGPVFFLVLGHRHLWPHNQKKHGSVFIS